MTREPAWLALARELQAIAQTGLTFTRDRFDIERYERLRVLASELMAAGSGLASAPIRALFAAEAGYATPKVDVRGAAFRDGSVLMVREASDRRWSLPGGWADVNQSPAEAVAREILEETGFEARAVKLAAAWDARRHDHPPYPHHVYKLVFLCEITGGAPRPSHETTEIGFFAEDALPELSLPRVTAPQIRRLFEHRRQPELPTDFD